MCLYKQDHVWGIVCESCRHLWAPELFIWHARMDVGAHCEHSGTFARICSSRHLQRWTKSWKCWKLCRHFQTSIEIPHVQFFQCFLSKPSLCWFQPYLTCLRDCPRTREPPQMLAHRPPLSRHATLNTKIGGARWRLVTRLEITQRLPEYYWTGRVGKGVWLASSLCAYKFRQETNRKNLF